MKFILTLLSAILFLAFQPRGEVYANTQLLSRVTNLFAQRENLKNVDELIVLLSQSSKEIDSSEVRIKFQLKYYYGRAQYYKAMHADLSKTNKLQLYESSMENFKSAKAVLDVADAYLWYAATLGRWAETKGISESLGRADELKRELEAAMTKTTFTGAAGKAVDGYGPNRILGRMYDKLPFFKGGSRAKAIENLNIAYTNSPLTPLNVIYRAEVYAKGGRNEKAEACRSLIELLKNDPKRLDLNRVPENIEDFAAAAQLKSEICN